jgi:hypothetical protein
MHRHAQTTDDSHLLMSVNKLFACLPTIHVNSISTAMNPSSSDRRTLVGTQRTGHQPSNGHGPSPAHMHLHDVNVMVRGWGDARRDPRAPASNTTHEVIHADTPRRNSQRRQWQREPRHASPRPTWGVNIDDVDDDDDDDRCGGGGGGGGGGNGDRPSHGRDSTSGADVVDAKDRRSDTIVHNDKRHIQGSAFEFENHHSKTSHHSDHHDSDHHHHSSHHRNSSVGQARVSRVHNQPLTESDRRVKTDNEHDTAHAATSADSGLNEQPPARALAVAVDPTTGRRLTRVERARLEAMEAFGGLDLEEAAKDCTRRVVKVMTS